MMISLIINIISNQLLTSLVAALVAFIMIPIFFLLLGKFKWKHKKFLYAFFRQEKWPIALIITLTILYFLFPFDEFTNDLFYQKIVFIGTIIAAILFSLRFLFVIKEIVFLRFPVDEPDNLQERKVRTQFLYIHYLLAIIIIIVGVSVIFWQFDFLQGIGTGLLASAGISGIIIAFAAQRMLGNFLAGFQIAFAQPFRIDDVVIVENEWGRIEEITMTYVVVRIWDQRRLVVPISYFIDKPFQNWTRTNAEIWGTVFLYVDYTTPIDEIRKELEKIVKTSPLWDGNVVGLQVTDTSERTITLRALMSAKDSSDAWDLRCLVREKLISFLQKNFPDSLPRLRIEEQFTAGEKQNKDESNRG
jgi:small-conductance mechanosensitive channel